MTAWRMGAAALLAFVPAVLQAEAPVANPPLPAITVTLAPGGQIHRYSIEVARSVNEQARGLMVRRTMPRDHGMIFPMDPPRDTAFWMEGTALPLDLVFIAPGHVVQRIAADAKPFDRTHIPSDGPVEAVLELNAGEAARIGLKPGDRVGYTLDGGVDRR